MKRIKICLMTLGFIVLCQCSSFPKDSSYVHHQNAPTYGSDSDFPYPVIDAHTHTRFDGRLERSSGIKVTEEEYMKERKEAGVVGTISHLEPDDAGYVKELHSKNTFFCAGVNNKVFTQKIEAGLKSGKYKCIKIYLGYAYKYATDKEYEKAYKLAQKYDVPVIYHTGDTYDADGKLKYSHPMAIDDVAVEHRKVRFVIAHCGNPWIQTAAEIVYKNPNVWLECSALLVGNLSEYKEETIHKYLVEPIKWIWGYIEDPSKLMFGTDWPLVGIKDYLRAYKQAIPREHWKAVFHDNAVKVFKFPVGDETIN